MKKETPQEVIDLARKCGFDTAEYWKRWHGYDVYEPYFDDSEIQMIGLPQFILSKDGKIRITHGEEGLNILH